MQSGSSYGAPSRDDCKQVQRRFGLSMTVLYDKQGRLNDVGLSTRHQHFVLDETAKIVHLARFNDGTFEPAVRELLDR